MCFECKKENVEQVSRRTFLIGAGAAVIGAAAGEKIVGQQVSEKALDDPTISHDFVTFKNGKENIQGYLARPKAAGRYRAVIVTHGNAGLPEDVRNTAAQLAQGGFTALAVNPTSRYPDLSKFPRETLKTNEFGVVMMKDIQAGRKYLDTLKFVKTGGVGIVGFCGGGIIAVLMSALVREISAAVAFYAAPFVSPENNTLSDPRPHMLSFVQWIKVPV